jgi:hypothetical protein
MDAPGRASICAVVVGVLGQRIGPTIRSAFGAVIPMMPFKITNGAMGRFGYLMGKSIQTTPQSKLLIFNIKPAISCLIF